MKRIILFINILLAIQSFSQSEIEIIGIKYRTTTKNNYYIYKSNNNKFDAFVNYGHDLGKKSKLFYHVSYHSFSLNTEVNPDIIILDDSYYQPSIPDYEFVNLAIGMTNNLKNNWTLNNIFAYTISDDFNETNLNQHNYFRSFSYLKKKKNDNLNYGFGIYLSKLNNSLKVYPILSLQYKNKKRGLKMFLPREIKFWNSINSKSYIELKTIINSNYLKFVDNNLDAELLSINSELTYNYIFKKKFKLKTGIGLPYIQYEYILNSKTYKTNQTNISFNLGISYVVFKND